MAKKRVKVPADERATVLAEYRHACAACGLAPLQVENLHHIDADPSHNDPFNLLPLCPNCHTRIERDKLPPGLVGILRLHKNPAILSIPFQRVFDRMAFLETPDAIDAEVLGGHADGLVTFIQRIYMGEEYAEKIKALLEFESSLLPIWFIGMPDEEWEARQAQHLTDVQAYRKELARVRPDVYALAVHLLEWQPWTSPYTR